MAHSMMRIRRLLPVLMVTFFFVTANHAFAEDNEHATNPPAAEASQVTHAAAEGAIPEANAHSGAHAERGLIPDLTDPKTWYEAAYAIVVFVIFFGLLSIFVWPKILASLQAREDKVRGDLKHAEDAAKQASATLAEYKQQLAEAQKQAQQIVDESRGAAQKVAAQMKEEAEAQMVQMRQRVESDINNAKERAVSEIYEQAGTLATQVAGQILRREINAGDQATLIRESIDKLRGTGNN